MKILGVRIDNLNRKEILAKIEFFLTEKRFHHIATVNPEFILAAQEDENFKSILNKCDLNIADAAGVWYAFIRNFQYLKHRIAGADLVHEILQIADQKKLEVYLAISENSLSSFEEIKKTLQRVYPNINIFGNTINPTGHWSLVIDHCDILLCNFGSPYQEKFINSVKNDTINLAIGVGGTFDFLTGKLKRAPRIMRILGLEWLFRLIQEPRYRFKRIINAVIIFPLRVIIKR